MSEFSAEISLAIESGSLQHSETSGRIQGAHKLPSARKIWLYPPILKFLHDWFQDAPSACQSLLFINGGEQLPHQDTIHLTPYPFGSMCGVWIQMEDMREEAGQFVVYPGSHRAHRQTTEKLHLSKVRDDNPSNSVFDRAIADIISEGGYERATLHLKAGQILIQHENLIYGGSKRLDSSLTPQCFVSHYFARGSVAYSDSRGEAAELELI